VVINDLDIVGVAFQPAKADAPLIIDPNTVLADSVSRELLKPVAGRHAQILQRADGIEHDQFALCDPVNVRRKSPGRLAPEELFGVPVPEASDHTGMLMPGNNNVKRYDAWA
jgi:hypothetical protein